MKMRKMVLRLSAGVGMDSAEFLLVPTIMSEEELSNYAWEAAVNFGQMYGLEPESSRQYYSEEEEEDEDFDAMFTDDIGGYFEEYNPEKHDGLVVGSFSEPEFRNM